MAQVTVRLNGCAYHVACDDGQENRLHELAGLVDERLRELVGQVGQVGDLRLMVMTCLILADELTDARGALAGTGVGEIEALAERMESLVESLEKK